MAETATKLGRVSLVPRGEYDAAATYNRLDIVEYEGSSYLVLADGTAGVTPASGTSYMLVAEKGDAGATGATGATGDTGPAGTDGEDGVGIQSIARTGGDGSPGTTDTYTITLTDGTTSTFTVYNGANGAQGPAGADGSSFVVLGRYDTLDALIAAHPTGSEGDAWAVGTPEDNDIYLWNVDTQTWDNVGSLQGPPGPAGADGATGADGQDGAQGPAGPGVAAGGASGQVLAKASDEDYATEWVDPPQTGVTSFNGRTGEVTPQAGDYTAEQVGALPITGGTVTGNVIVAESFLNVRGPSVNGSYYQILMNGGTSTGITLKGGNNKVKGLLLNGDSSNAVVTMAPSPLSSDSGLIKVRVGGIGDPVYTHEAANKAYVDTHALTIASNAGAHNSIFRGKNLGTSVTAAQYAAISAGTFEDLFIGDYWVINGVNWRIAAFDYYLGTGSTAVTAHHVTIVPDTKLDTQKMNDTNVTTGGYMGSKMYTANLATAKSKIYATFPDHTLTHAFYLSNAVTTGKVTSTAASYEAVVLMSERNVYGQSIMSSECNDGSAGPNWYTYERTQFPLFALAPEFIQKERSAYWLRDVVTASSFAYVNSTGYAHWYYASASYGVRPAFSIS